MSGPVGLLVTSPTAGQIVVVEGGDKDENIISVWTEYLQSGHHFRVELWKIENAGT